MPLAINNKPILTEQAISQKIIEIQTNNPNNAPDNQTNWLMVVLPKNQKHPIITLLQTDFIKLNLPKQTIIDQLSYLPTDTKIIASSNENTTESMTTIKQLAEVNHWANQQQPNSSQQKAWLELLSYNGPESVPYFDKEYEVYPFGKDLSANLAKLIQAKAKLLNII